jgi:hypothetical protein
MLKSVLTVVALVIGVAAFAGIVAVGVVAVAVMVV